MDTNFEEINLKADLASPALTGTPTAPTQAVGDNSTKIATTAFVSAEIAGDVGVANSSLVKTALNASGSAPIYACRAWVNFKGTDTVAIRASGNVSSIIDNGIGDYTVNFATAMVDANYSSVGSCTYMLGGTVRVRTFSPYVLTTTSLRVLTGYTDTTLADHELVAVSIFK
jgi:hypothetical protein